MRGPTIRRTLSSTRPAASFGVLAIASALAACPGELDVEGRTFPCRAPADCAEGYECHPTRWVCVPLGSADAGARPDAGARDGGATIRGIGDRCSPVGSCDEGICVDGYCCENACTDDCRRCDLTPGRCTPVQDGTDPDGECASRAFDCARYTFGAAAGSCYAFVSGTVSGGTCGPTGACRPLACDGMGEAISKCENAGCAREDACPAGAPVSEFDETSELCGSGPEAACTFEAGGTGCCSALGACCPSPTCTPDQGACE